MGNRHEPTVEATTLEASKTLVSCRLGWGAGLPAEG